MSRFRDWTWDTLGNESSTTLRATSMQYCIFNYWLKYGLCCNLIIKLTSICDKTICTYNTYNHDAKYLFWAVVNKDKWGVGSPLNLSLINSIPTETAKHLLNKNRDTNTHEIKMEALKLQYLSLSWNGESCFQLTNYIM